MPPHPRSKQDDAHKKFPLKKVHEIASKLTMPNYPAALRSEASECMAYLAKTVERQREELAAAHDTMTETHAQLDKTSLQAAQRVEEHEKEVARARDDLLSALKEIKDLKNTLHVVQGERDQALDQVKEDAELMEKLGQKVQQLDSSSNDTIEALSKSRAAIVKELNTKCQQVSDNRSTIASLKKSNESLETEAKRLQEQMAAVKLQSKNDLEAYTEKMQAKFEEQRSDFEKEVAALKQAAVDSEASLRQRLERFEKSEAERFRMREEELISERDAIVAKLAGRIESLRAALENERTTNREQRAELKADAATTIRELKASYDAQISQLKGDVSRLTDERNSSQAECVSLRATLEDTIERGTRAAMNQHLSVLQHQIAVIPAMIKRGLIEANFPGPLSAEGLQPQPIPPPPSGAKPSFPAKAKRIVSPSPAPSTPPAGEPKVDAAPPTPQEIIEYARHLGIDPVFESGLLWVAEEALHAALPGNWTENFSESGHIYYYNVATDESTYHHPMDESFKSLLTVLRRVQDTQEQERLKAAIMEGRGQRHQNELIDGALSGSATRATTANSARSNKSSKVSSFFGLRKGKPETG
eukprot:Rmarinus@m.20592